MSDEKCDSMDCGHKNCYEFNQLEAENEELKLRCSKYERVNREQFDDVQNIHRENEALKKRVLELEKLCVMEGEPGHEHYYKDEVKALVEKDNKLTSLCKTLAEALEKIGRVKEATTYQGRGEHINDLAMVAQIAKLALEQYRKEMGK